MSKVAFTLAIWSLSLTALFAQVKVEVLLDQEQFLRDESLPVKVRISNRSGQKLELGQDPHWVTFVVQRRDGFNVPSLAEPSLGDKEFSLDSAMAATRSVDLMPCFDLSLPGQYFVTATVKLKQWNREVSSPPKKFEIVRGTTLWEQEFGVPTADGLPEMRKYTLQQARYLTDLMLYVRVTDAAESRVFRVFPAGRLLSFSRPDPQVDRQSQLHLLSQYGPRSFQYLVITPYGTIVQREFHDYTSTRPVLRSQEDGRIFVNGGIRRRTLDDLPPPSLPPAETNEVSTPKP